MALPKVKGKASIGKFKVAGGHFKFKELKERFSGSGDGPVVYLKPGEDKKLRFINAPEEWRIYDSHRMQKGDRWFDVPCIGDGCPACDQEESARNVALIPVYDVEKKKIKFIKASSRLMNDLLTIYNRTNKKGKSKLLDRDYNLLREGEGKETRYLLDAEEPEKRPEVKDIEIPDPDALLRKWVELYYGGEGTSKSKAKDKDDDDDDDEFEDKKKKKKSKAKDDDDDDEDEEEKSDDDDDDEEEEEEEKPRKRGKKKPKKLKSKKKSDSDDDEDDDEDEEEEEEDDD